MSKNVKLIIKIIAILLVIVIIPFGGIMAYSNSNEAGVVPTYIWTENDTINTSDMTSYQLDNDGEFKILQLSDVQFGLILPLGGKATAYITDLINDTDPDLIIFAGDITSSPINGIIYREFVDFMDLFGIPYAVVFGNHDAEGRASKEKLANILSEGKYSIFKYGPSNITGIGNYVVNVKNAENDIAWSLFMMDSNMYNGDYYDYIHEDQIDWYSWNVEKLKSENGGSLNSLAFFHIPLLEFAEAWGKRNTEEVTYVFGDKRETECASNYNSGMFETMVSLESTKGVFVGHDHINDYSVIYKGIQLTYGLKSTTNSYDEDGVRGGLLITLTDGSYTVEQIFRD